MPNEVDLLKQLANEGLQAQPGEAITPKGPAAKKKGKKNAADFIPYRDSVRIRLHFATHPNILTLAS